MTKIQKFECVNANELKPIDAAELTQVEGGIGPVTAGFLVGFNISVPSGPVL